MASNHVKVAGVSVKLLNDFIAKVQQYDGASELTVTECITQIIVPETFQTKKPYTSLYANSEDYPDFVGEANAVAILCESSPVLDLLEVVAAYSHEKSGQSLFFYIDIFCDSQHKNDKFSTIHKLQEHLDAIYTSSMTQVLVVLKPWPNPDMLRNTFCLYQLFLAASRDLPVDFRLFNEDNVRLRAELLDRYEQVVNFVAEVSFEKTSMPKANENDVMMAILRLQGFETPNRQISGLLFGWMFEISRYVEKVLLEIIYGKIEDAPSSQTEIEASLDNLFPEQISVEKEEEIEKNLAEVEPDCTDSSEAKGPQTQEESLEQSVQESSENSSAQNQIETNVKQVEITTNDEAGNRENEETQNGAKDEEKDPVKTEGVDATNTKADETPVRSEKEEASEHSESHASHNENPEDGSPETRVSEDSVDGENFEDNEEMTEPSEKLLRKKKKSVTFNELVDVKEVIIRARTPSEIDQRGSSDAADEEEVVKLQLNLTTSLDETELAALAEKKRQDELEAAKLTLDQVFPFTVEDETPKTDDDSNEEALPEKREAITEKSSETGDVGIVEKENGKDSTDGAKVENEENKAEKMGNLMENISSQSDTEEKMEPIADIGNSEKTSTLAQNDQIEATATNSEEGALVQPNIQEIPDSSNSAEETSSSESAHEKTSDLGDANSVIDFHRMRRASSFVSNESLNGALSKFTEINKSADFYNKFQLLTLQTNIGGMLSSLANHSGTAAKYYLKAMENQTNVFGPANEFVAHSKRKIAEILESENKVDQCLEHYEQTLAILRGLEDDAMTTKKLIARVTLKISDVHHSQRNTKMALSYYLDSLRAMEMVDDIPEADFIRVHERVGNIYLKEKDFDKALYHLETADEKIRKLKSESGDSCNSGASKASEQIRNYLRMSRIYFAAQQFSNVVTKLTRAYELIKEQREKDVPEKDEILDLLGCSYFQLGETSEAIDKFEELLISVESKDNQSVNMGLTCCKLGRCHLTLGNFDKSLFYFDKDLEIQILLHGSDSEHVGRAYANLGEIHHKKGETLSTLDLWKKAYWILENALGQGANETILVKSYLEKLIWM